MYVCTSLHMYMRCDFSLASATLSVGELLDQLKWHRKQLQAGTHTAMY